MDCASEGAAMPANEIRRPASMVVIFLFMIASLFAVVLLVRDLFHPYNALTVERTRDGDMRLT
jgi:energy-converting hydrogenase Eha subunit F